MSRHTAFSPSTSRRAAQWPSHLRQFQGRPGSDRSSTSIESPQSPDTISLNSNSTVREAPPLRRIPERICSVTINDSLQRQEVLLNLDLIGGGIIQPGTLMSITAVRSDIERSQTPLYGSTRQSSSQRPPTIPDDFSRPDGDVGRYTFVVKDIHKDLKVRQPNIEVYVPRHIGDAFNMRKGTQVVLAPVDTLSPVVEASHVELSFKDMYLSRADMWRLAVADLAEKTVYKGQVVYFLGTIKATVSTVFVEGRKVQSAFFGRHTRPIFRSESARYVLFIQMAREMWDFDSDGSGEIMFYKVVNGFLPALFKKWAVLQVKHLVSIVLFARVEYDTGLTTELANTALNNDYYTGFQTSGEKRPYKDFYRVVVSEMSSGEWTKILHQLKKEFNVFRRDISLHHQVAMSDAMEILEDVSAKSTSTSKIKAESSPAMHGNFLEAINLASSLYAHDYIDRDLLRTGISIVVISPGSGVFDVEYETLRKTTEALIGNGIGIDLICIPNLPLHSVPLFRYRNPLFGGAGQESHSRSLRSRDSTPKQATPTAGSYSTLSGSLSPRKGAENSSRIDSVTSRIYADEWAFALPQWLHVSYWTGKSEEALAFHGASLSAISPSSGETEEEFTIRCRLYDLQMRSVIETNEIETTPLHIDPTYPKADSKMTAKGALHSGENHTAAAKTRKVPDGLFEPVYGFQKFTPDKLTKSGETSLWKQLQAFDESRARLPPERVFSGAQLYHDLKEATKKQQVEDMALFGSSVGDKRTTDPPAILSSSVASSNKVTEPGSPEPSAMYRRSSTASSVQPKLTQARTPKLMRQISLGQRGFGFAAPKASVAEVKVEHVNAMQSSPSGISRIPSSSRITPATPTKIATKASSIKASSGSTLSTTLDSTRFESPNQALGKRQKPSAWPIQIKGSPLALEPVSTLKSGPILATPMARSTRQDDMDIKYSNVLRDEDQKKLYNSKLRAGGVPELPSTLSPGTAMAPWLVVLNPSNPNASRVDPSILFSRWQHVFPKPSEMKVMKWKSLSCPAAVPLTTETFPTQAQFNTEYQRQPYNIAQEYDDDLSEEPKSRAEFLRELVSARFAHGFQVVIGPSVAKAFDQKAVRIADIFSIDNTVGDGTSIFMSVGNTIHQLSCVNGTEVEVNIYIRKPTESMAHSDHLPSLYKPAIRTYLDETYRSVNIDILTPKPERNWNYIDSYLAGHTDEMTENLRFWRARFVLIPMYPRTSVPAGHNEDDEEEVRLEGINKLAQTWQRHRYLSPSERHFQSASARKRDPNPLDIIYKTEDASVVIAAEMETLPIFENFESTHRKGLVSNKERFSKSNFNVAALAEAIQQPVEAGGIRMQTRRWHFQLHYHCFIGSDMTTWLLDNFEDLESREEAVELGNTLMVYGDDKCKDKDRDFFKDTKKDRDRGIFVHVEKRHNFRDGQYFYQIAPDFAKLHPPGWLNRKRVDASVPSTPMAETIPRGSPGYGQPSTLRPASNAEENSPMSGNTTPTMTTPANSGKRPKVNLSKVMKYNVDHRKKSYRPERINLHYDRLHNPDNCYHIRIEWMNVTAKLIEDAIKTWAAIAAHHGLRLVEVPIAEACDITEINAFRKPYRIKLAIPPPSQQPVTYYDPSSLTPQPQPGKHFYHKALLRKFDYVLDLEAASNFPSNVDVNYSWGKPNFKFSQFIHRSGILLIEITDEGDFLLLANRLYSNRALASQVSQVHNNTASNERGLGGTTSALYTNYGLVEPTPISSPMTRPVLFAPFGSKRPPERSLSRIGGTSGLAGVKPSAGPGLFPEPESLANTLETFCSDKDALEAFYKETLERGIGTPTAAAAVPDAGTVSDAGIPTLGLPPGILGSGEIMASPSPRVGTPTSSLANSLLFRRGSVQH